MEEEKEIENRGENRKRKMRMRGWDIERRIRRSLKNRIMIRKIGEMGREDTIRNWRRWQDK